jgi:hypothetical protein
MGLTLRWAMPVNEYGLAVEREDVPLPALLYTKRQASEMLQISVAALDKLHAKGEGPRCLVISGRRLYPLAALQQFIVDRI